MVAGLVIKTAKLGAVTATENFAFQQLPKYRRWRCILHRWRQTVPHARTSETECTVTYDSLSRPEDI